MVALFDHAGQHVPMAAITPSLCRAARGLLGWTGEDLARHARVALNTVRKFEAAKSTPMPNNLAAIQAAFEMASVEFTNGDAPGVRLRSKAGSGA